MEMEGRGFSDLLRNTSEEIFLKTMMENPIGITAPSMEMLGFKNITHSLRGDSEELFHSWLTNGEALGHGSIVAHRTKQASRRTSTDLTSSQQNGVSFRRKNSDDNTFAHNLNAIDEHSNDLGQCSLRNAAEKGMQASNLYLAKAWFHSSQPMTRSRSSELRRRYAAMQSSQMATIPQEPNNIPLHGTNKMQLEFANANSFGSIQMAEMSNQKHSLMSPSNSSTSFNTPQIATPDKVSSVVSMLKGTLERKKLNNRGDKEVMEGSNSSPALSTGFEACDGPAHSGHTIYNGVISSRHVGNGPTDHELKVNDYCDRIFENRFNDARKKASLVRMGSISSAASVDKSDPTKKRRVERSRKMAEAKERNSTPPLPSDMQAILKRFETLEKEVRSLKLNLSFMNRKDSEQTKKIEDLQKQNDELVNEKELLLEEIERIISDSGKM